MKKIVFIMSIGLFSLASEAQVISISEGSQISFRKSPDFDDTAIVGSRYLSENFKLAKVNKGTEDFLIRYNAYGDVMEYKNGSDLLELIKEKNTHFTFEDGTIYELFSYTLGGKTYDRYHQVLIDNKSSKISKYKSIKLTPAEKASNSYDTDTPASYKVNKDIYFITYNGQTYEFDGKQKTLEKIIPSKKDAIKKFYKENRIRENDADMIRVGQFLAQL